MPKTATAIAITTGLPILGFEFLLIECANPDDCSRQINRNGGEGSLQGGACLPAMTAIHEPSLQEQFFALPVAGSSTKELNNGDGNKRNRFHYPLPWQSLKYDTNLGGYRTGITETQLKGAPKYGNDNAWNWSDPDRTRAVNDYYGVAI